jgi:hypothetical protein
MKNYKKAISVIASLALTGAAIGAFLTQTERGKKMLSDLKKRKECNGKETIESL